MKRMLFNATQQEELRVAIVNGKNIIDLDIENANKQQKKGNIYKAVITRIEPSLEACFVDYGEDRHGFLPFKEINKIYLKRNIDFRIENIKDAIEEGQEIIVQVDKEERGNKGAALTTYISLAGRYLVLMPNNPRGGGVSRRVEGEEREELKDLMGQLSLPSGMSAIGRTAGIGRSIEELKWDLSYLVKLWSAIESAVNENPAPILIYLESSLVIRAIRDYFQPDIQEILIDTDEIYEQAYAFISLVMPDNISKLKKYKSDVPLFSRFKIEQQIETAHSRTVSLPSGGAIVIDHTEALVSIDVNSAKANRWSDISETAIRTNLEAADEIARQLRLRDIGGLIVIDFIDMDNPKHQRDVENRIKDALHSDRARVQMSKISRFGLMEISRQRLRPALAEGSHITCPRCNGTGHIRDVQSSSLQILRIIQEEALQISAASIYCQVPIEVAAFLLNEKRSEIIKIENHFKLDVCIIPNKKLETPHYKVECIKEDDPKLDNVVLSYKAMDNEITNDDTLPYNKKSTDDSTSTVKVKPQAVVKMITHDNPAPIIVKNQGLWNKILQWFKSWKLKNTIKNNTYNHNDNDYNNDDNKNNKEINNTSTTTSNENNKNETLDKKNNRRNTKNPTNNQKEKNNKDIVRNKIKRNYVEKGDENWLQDSIPSNLINQIKNDELNSKKQIELKPANPLESNKNVEENNTNKPNRNRRPNNNSNNSKNKELQKESLELIGNEDSNTNISEDNTNINPQNNNQSNNKKDTKKPVAKANPNKKEPAKTTIINEEITSQKNNLINVDNVDIDVNNNEHKQLNNINEATSTNNPIADSELNKMLDIATNDIFGKLDTKHKIEPDNTLEWYTRDIKFTTSEKTELNNKQLKTTKKIWVNIPYKINNYILDTEYNTKENQILKHNDRNLIWVHTDMKKLQLNILNHKKTTSYKPVKRTFISDKNIVENMQQIETKIKDI